MLETCSGGQIYNVVFCREVKALGRYNMIYRKGLLMW